MLDIKKLRLQSKYIHPSKELADDKCGMSNNVTVRMIIVQAVVIDAIPRALIPVSVSHIFATPTALLTSGPGSPAALHIFKRPIAVVSVSLTFWEKSCQFVTQCHCRKYKWVAILVENSDRFSIALVFVRPVSNVSSDCGGANSANQTDHGYDNRG